MQKLGRRPNPLVRWMLISIVVGASLGCEQKKSNDASTDKSLQTEVAGETGAQGAVRAIARMKPTEGSSVSGTVEFEPSEEGVRVRASLAGLEPSSVHGFHIHEKGDCSAPDASSAGGHYAPQGAPHGLPPETKRHAGDMGNVLADDDGNVDLERTFTTFSVEGGDAPVLKLAVIVHAKSDDGTQPTGAAGARLACGIIQPVKTANED